jgi:hypothetical protein
VLPAQARPVAAHAVRASFTAGLNEVFLVGALLALVSSVLTLLLIRSRDFESGAARGAQSPDAAGAASALQPSSEQPPEQPSTPPARGAQPAQARIPERPPVNADATAETLLRGAETVIAAAGQASPDYEPIVEGAGTEPSPSPQLPPEA